MFKARICGWIGLLPLFMLIQYRRNFDVLQMQLILNNFFCGYR